MQPPVISRLQSRANLLAERDQVVSIPPQLFRFCYSGINTFVSYKLGRHSPVDQPQIASEDGTAGRIRLIRSLAKQSLT